MDISARVFAFPGRTPSHRAITAGLPARAITLTHEDMSASRRLMIFARLPALSHTLWLSQVTVINTMALGMHESARSSRPLRLDSSG